MIHSAKILNDNNNEPVLPTMGLCENLDDDHNDQTSSREIPPMILNAKILNGNDDEPPSR